jgi:hypothetical protein
MGYLIGTDEAGYGPNLGPLVISATVWKTPEGVCAGDLYQRLQSIVAPAIERTANGASSRVAIADSKVLYQAGTGLRHLERGLWVALAVLGRQANTWREMWQALAPECVTQLLAAPWHADYDVPLPAAADPEELKTLGPAVEQGLAAANVAIVNLLSRVVFPDEFNDLTASYGSKGAALSHLTMELLVAAMAPLDHGPISVICDKHGGRNCYGPLLSQHFPEWLVEIYGEGRQQSVYRFGPQHRRLEIRFCTKAEAYLPVALASMASKYLRELSMQAFNAYWCQRIAGLQRTAGYPADALRFKTAIAAVQQELGIEDHILWRVK